MGAVLAALLTLLPWCVWFSFVTAPTAIVILGAISIACSFHGWGRLVARLAGRTDVDGALAMQWGVAAVVAVAGPMLALRVYEPRLLLVAGVAAHSLDVTLRFASVTDAFRARLTWPQARFWLVPFALIAVVALVSTLAAAGQVDAHPYDDDGHVVAQVQRISTTGALEDPIGFARDVQLGGHVALGGLATPLGDPRLASIVDLGVGLLMFLVLLCSRTRPRDGDSTIWTSLLVIVFAALQLPNDSLPIWIPAGLLLALHATLTTTSTQARAMLPIGLVAAALCVIRAELAPASIVMVVAVWWRDRNTVAHDWRRLAVVVLPIAVVIAAYMVSRAQAWSSVGGGAHAMLVKPSSWKRLGAMAAIAVATIPLASLALRELEDRTLRMFAIATAIAIACVAGRLVGTPPISTQMLWPIIIALVTAVAIDVARHVTLARTAMVIAALACILVVEAQTAPGRKAWPRRLDEVFADIGYARNLATEPGVYDALLARVPIQDRVAVWVVRPELLDYQHHDIVDLRTPRVAKVNLARLVRETHARWLLVEAPIAPGLEDVVENARSRQISQGIQLVELH